MTTVVLTTASTSPWTVPGDFKVAGHTVTLIGSGGNGAVSTTGTTSIAGGGGGGGACTRLVYSSGTITPGSTTIAFLINTAGSANATQWQSSTAGTGNFYEALPGGNASGATAGPASGATTTVGTPTIVYTPTNHTGAAGGSGGGANTLGGAGGGGAGGLNANGGGGGTSTSTGGSGGGGGGAANAGSNAASATGAAGGNGSTGTGGTSGGTPTGNTGTGSSGGGGSNGGTTSSTGGLGGSGNDFAATAGCGGGGGGAGGNTANSTINPLKGGTGGNYGGGGGGCGCSRATTSTITAGPGAAGVIVVAYSSTTWGWDQAQERIQPPPVGSLRARRGAARGRSEFAIFAKWVNLGTEQVRSQEPRRKWEQRGSILRGDDGTQAKYVFAPVNQGYEQVRSQEPPSVGNIRARRGAARGRSEFAFFKPWVNQGYEQVRSQEPRLKWEQRGSILRGDDGTQAKYVFVPPPLPPNFDVVDAQDILLTKWQNVRGQQFAALARGDDGLEAPFFSWKTGWEVQPPQPPHPRYKLPPLGDPLGTDAQFVQWRNMGWEVQPPQPPHPRYKPPTLGDPLGNDAQFVQWQNFGWEQTQALTRYRLYKTPDIGDSGIEFPTAPTVVPIIFFDIVDAQDILLTKWQNVRGQQFAALARGDDGSEAPFVNWLNAGWEVQPPQPPHPRYKPPTLGDPLGVDAQFVQWRNFGWEVQPPQPPHHWFKSPTLGDPLGVDAQFIQWRNFGWEVQPPQPPHPKYRSPETGDTGTQSPFVQWYNLGWEQIHALTRYRLYHTPDIGDSGIENTFTFIPLPQYQFIDWPAPPHHPQPKPWRGAATMRGDDGTEAPYARWFNAGWEVQPPQPPHPRYKVYPLGDPLGVDSPFTQWQNYGWEQTQALTRFRLYHTPDVGDSGTEYPFIFVPLPQFQFIDWPAPPMHPQPKPWRGANFMRGDDGTEAPYARWFNAGWEVQPHQPQHRWFKSPDVGDAGIQDRFRRFQANFDVVDAQDNLLTKWYNTRGQGFGALARGDDGIEAKLFSWLNGWEIQSPHVPHPRYRNFDRGDEGTEFPFVRVTPITWGWEQTQALTRYALYKTPDVGDSGIENTFIFVLPGQFTVIDWPAPPVYTQPKPWRAASFMLGDSGIENTFTFVPPPIVPTFWWGEAYADPLRWRMPTLGFSFQTGFLAPPPWHNFGFEQAASQDLHARFKSPDIGDSGTEFIFLVPLLVDGWAVQPWQPPHQRYKSPDVGDSQGIDFRFINWANAGWEVQPPQPPHPRYKPPTIGDPDGIDAPFIQWRNFGWEVQPPQPPHHWFKSPEFGDQGTENVFTFVPLPALSGYDIQPALFRRVPRGAGLFRGIDGIEATKQVQGVWGFDIQPAFFRPRPHPSAIFKGIDGIDRPSLWINTGWEVQYSDVRFNPQNRRPAAIMLGDSGNEAPFNFFYPFGWEVQPPQPPAFAFMRARTGGAYALGDPGRQQILINAPPPFGWLIQPWQPPTPIIIHARAGGIMIGDSGIYDIFHPVTPPPPTPGLHMVGLIDVTAHVGRGGYDPDPNP